MASKGHRIAPDKVAGKEPVKRGQVHSYQPGLGTSLIQQAKIRATLLQRAFANQFTPREDE